MAKTPPSRVSTSRILADLRLAAKKGDRAAMSLALDQMRTLAHSPKYWEKYLTLLRNPLARLVDLLVIKQGERIAHQKGWKLPKATASVEKPRKPASKAAKERGPRAPAPRRPPRRCRPRSSSDAAGRRRRQSRRRRGPHGARVAAPARAGGGHAALRAGRDARPRRRRAPRARGGGGGAPLVVAVGGDGTLNEIVNGVTRAPGPSAVVGAVLTGRGRDVCRVLGRRRRPTAAVRVLGVGQDRRFDLGRGRGPTAPGGYVITAGAGSRRRRGAARRHRRPARHAAVRDRDRQDSRLARDRAGRGRGRRCDGVGRRAQQRGRGQRRVLRRRDEDRAGHP